MAGARFEMKLVGGEKLLDELRAAGGNAKKVVRAATRIGAKVIAAEAEIRARAIGSGSGKHVKVISGRGRNMSAVMHVGITDRKWFFRFFETGAGRHEITGAPLMFEGERGRVITGRVIHPGMAARPFLRPAADTKAGDTVAAMSEAFRAAIEEKRLAADSGDDAD